MAPSPYPIGTVARRSGLTVRALHHYDALGLLRPSHRTDAGHRRYTDADVARLRRLTALRALGLPLDRIGALLDDPDADPIAEVEAQAARVRASIQQSEALLDRLGALADLLRRGTRAPSDALFHLIHLTTMHESYYTPEQRAAIQQRGETLGPDGLRAAEQEWAGLIARANAAVAAGTPPERTRQAQEHRPALGASSYAPSPAATRAQRTTSSASGTTTRTSPGQPHGPRAHEVGRRGDAGVRRFAPLTHAASASATTRCPFADRWMPSP